MDDDVISLMYCKFHCWIPANVYLVLSLTILAGSFLNYCTVHPFFPAVLCIIATRFYSPPPILY